MALIFKIKSDPRNQFDNLLNDVVIVEAFDEDTGRVPIDPKTNQPLVLPAFQGPDWNAENLSRWCSQYSRDYYQRVELVAIRDAARAERDAIAQAGGIILLIDDTALREGQATAKALLLKLAALREARKPGDADLLAAQDAVDALSKDHPEYFGIDR